MYGSDKKEKTGFQLLEQWDVCVTMNRIIRNFSRGDNALIRTFTQWRLYTNRLSCWSSLSLSRPSASPARDVALNFEGISAPLCVLESCSCRRLCVMCDAICLPFCSVNARGLLYITVCRLVLVKQYLCLCDRVCMFVYCKQPTGQ